MEIINSKDQLNELILYKLSYLNSLTLPQKNHSF